MKYSADIAIKHSRGQIGCKRVGLAPQDAFGAQFKALQGISDATEDEQQDSVAEQPQELDKHTEHGFWTASPIWSSESASSGETNLVSFFQECSIVKIVYCDAVRLSHS